MQKRYLAQGDPALPVRKQIAFPCIYATIQGKKKGCDAQCTLIFRGRSEN